VDNKIDSEYKRNSFDMKLSVSPTSSVDSEMDSEYKRDSFNITDVLPKKRKFKPHQSQKSRIIDTVRRNIALVEKNICL
jgi:hypothetical protein